MSPSAEKTKKVSESVQTARQMIEGKLPHPEFKPLKKLINELTGRQEFRLAGKLLEIARQGPWDNRESVWIVQQLALCTYKDEERVPVTRFAQALELLKIIGLGDAGKIDPTKIHHSTLPVTLGLGGAIYKRKWEYGGQIEDLQQAMVFFLEAWETDQKMDMGYGGVNAAFVLDVLASRAKVIALRSGSKDDTESQRLRTQARNLREVMADKLPEYAAERNNEDYPGIEEEYWYLATMAEVHFGLSNFKEAGNWLARALKAHKVHSEDYGPATSWQIQTTFRQLVTLARYLGWDLLGDRSQTGPVQQARDALRKLLGNDTDSALSCYRGRVGLALSGGGFRASLFHLGVLARLAEADVLRSVEVLSTVSGGSIVGAHYYLKVRQKLNSKPDSQIGRIDYIEIVQEVIDEFMAGISRNLRTRALTNLIANLKMIVLQTYSTSHRMGELYEKHLYSRVNDDHPPGQPRRMAELVIAPVVRQDGVAVERDNAFKPKFSNWIRAAKAPVLLLNTTSLNSGHSWHFTATWMGEPPGLVGQEVDVIERYRRLYYPDAPTRRLQNYRLGHAVAASAGVPGLFQPLVLKGLYPGRTVRLVDGGVHDNQGVGGLLNEGCTVVFCSDASGQMADMKRPADNALGVSLRANSVLQSRVREAGYQDLKSRVESHALQGLFFIHLKKGLEAAPLDWIDCQDPTVPPNAPPATTPYGVDKDLQKKLAAIRTDLDSFTEVEAYSLMISGYLMTEHELKTLDEQRKADGEPGTWGGFEVNAPRGQWRFLDLEPLVRKGADDSDARRQDLGLQLEAGASGAFKIWKLSPALKGIAIALGIAALVGLGWWLRVNWECEVPVGPFTLRFKHLVWVTAASLAAIIVPAFKWLRPMQAMRGYFWKAVVAFAGWVVANLHVLFFDWLYLRRGRLDRLLRLP
ncbi:MAG: patatin-like phospholipase family protein [Acidobacteriia bacterium]|nr:patatin-like phospholipase family protein [Terriglobia bacterium]